MSTVLFIGIAHEEVTSLSMRVASPVWTPVFVEDIGELEQRLKLHPVSALVVPLDHGEIPAAEVAAVARQYQVPLIVCGDEPPAAVGQSDVAGYVQRSEFADAFHNVLEEVLDAAATRNLRRELEGCIAERSLRIVVGNDKARAPAIVQLLIAECDRMNAIREEDHFRVAIAIEEALVNAIVHGNLEVSSELRESGDDEYEETIALRRTLPEYRDRKVTILCSISRERIELQITDEGPGFDVSTIPDPTDPDYLERPCGRGLLLMRTFMDRVKYNSRGNSVTLTKRVPQPDPAETAALAIVEACSA